MDYYIFLKSLMHERGLSIPDIARICGLSDSTLRSAIERKQKRVVLDVALKLSAGLGIPVETINNGWQKEKPVPEDELSQIQKELIELVSSLPDERALQVYELVQAALRLSEK